MPEVLAVFATFDIMDRTERTKSRAIQENVQQFTAWGPTLQMGLRVPPAGHNHKVG